MVVSLINLKESEFVADSDSYLNFILSMTRWRN